MQNQQNKLIDVIELSKKLNSTPIQGELAYATRNNFLGRIVAGYHPDAKHICWMAPKAAEALCQAQSWLNERGLGLFIYDSYRPLRAVKDFCKWMHSPVQDDHELERKAIHYPNIDKDKLADLHYVCDTVSNHCFGDTVDLVLVDLQSREFLDMGACYDFFDERSHPTMSAEVIGDEAYKNRMMLADAMVRVGYTTFATEYWHFTFCEREIGEAMDFEIRLEVI